MKYSQKWPIYAEQLNRMVIKESRRAEMERYARFGIDHKETYLRIEAETGVPWPLTTVLHRRESDSDFSTYLGNGQSLSRVTTIVPKGRGPFFGPNAFIDGAKDAFAIDGLSSVVPPWPVEKMLYYCEIFNGLGYENKGLPSPYIWGGTNIQKPGKYVRDGVFDPGFWDTQPGCAAILWMLGYLDTSIHFERESPYLGQAQAA